jgi:hypothetical protein
MLDCVAFESLCICIYVKQKMCVRRLYLMSACLDCQTSYWIGMNLPVLFGL